MKNTKKFLELKTLFENLSYDDLESLYTLLSLTGRIDDEFSEAIDSTYFPMYNKLAESGEFEGRNEYDNLTRYHNFSLSKIMDLFNRMTDTQLNEICKLVGKAYGKILEELKTNECSGKIEMLPKLDEFIKRFNKRKEAKEILKKLSRSDQVLFGSALDLSVGFDVGDEKEVLRRIISESKSNKTGKLNNNQLYHIHDITSSALGVLNLEVFEDLTYQRSLIEEFNGRVSKEIENRKAGKGAKTLTP